MLAADTAGSVSSMLAAALRIVVTVGATAMASSTLDTVATWAQILGGAAAVLALPFIAWQVASARWIAKDERTAAVATEWQALNLSGDVSGVSAFLHVADTRDCIAKIRSWRSAATSELRCLPRTPRDAHAPLASRLEVLRRLTFYEYLSASYNAKTIHTSRIASLMGANLLYEFLDASWFIYWSRAEWQDDFAFREWEATVRDLRRTRWRWSRRRDPVYAWLRSATAELRICAICVPPLGAPDAAWAQAERLSVALAEPSALGEPSTPVRKQHIPLAASPSQGGWVIALLPGSLDDSPEQHRRNKALTVAIDSK